jgi:hypothetical protein
VFPSRSTARYFWSAAITIAGIEIMHMIRKDQFAIGRKVAFSAAVLFVDGMNLFRLLVRIQPVAKFATEAPVVSNRS